MAKENFRELDGAELASREKEIREQIFRLRFQMSLGQTDGLGKYRALKKDRARLLTVRRERELAAAKEGK